ncbi:MAG TPA: ZPR1 zinc finger domain-containing protein [Archaeoglobus sp.]|nr:ZPR1 zinc finger domain-containing protein [Archaeoglobus sp.]
MTLCPKCGRELKVKTVTYPTPYFGEILLTSLTCECGFKYANTLILGFNYPVRFTIKINKETLYTKVVRSTSCTIRIPEIQTSIEPGPASQAFITNLEGILRRVEDAVRMAMRWHSHDIKKVERCKQILEKINRTIEGNEELTLILEDPLGNSAIISDQAFKERMSEDEIRELKTGMYELDVLRI